MTYPPTCPQPGDMSRVKTTRPTSDLTETVVTWGEGQSRQARRLLGLEHDGRRVAAAFFASLGRPVPYTVTQATWRPAGWSMSATRLSGTVPVLILGLMPAQRAQGAFHKRVGGV